MLGSFLFSGDDAQKPARVLSGGEKTRLALATLVVSSANVLLLDEPTNNLDPASREEVLAAIRAYEGAIVLVTHDEGAVHALEPDRVLLLPDGVEDLWTASYADLVSPGLSAPIACAHDSRGAEVGRTRLRGDRRGRRRDPGPTRGAQRADPGDVASPRRHRGAGRRRGARRRGAGERADVLGRPRPGDARPLGCRRRRGDGRGAARDVRRGRVRGDRAVPARLHLAARPAVRVDRCRAGVRHRRGLPARARRATCGSSPRAPSCA